MVFIEPTTRQRVVCAKHCGDIQFFLDSQPHDSAVDYEDVPLLGNWSDFTGSGEVDSRNLQLWGGHENEMWGTDAGIEGAKVGNLTPIGTRAGTHRRRNVLTRKRPVMVRRQI